MALACLACHAMENSTDSFRMDSSFRAQNMSVSSDGGSGPDGCARVSACFTKKAVVPSGSSSRPQHVVGQPSPGSASPAAATMGVLGRRQGAMNRMVFPEPRLTRCHAVRRDLFSNWTISDIEAECMGRQMPLNLSTTA